LREKGRNGIGNGAFFQIELFEICKTISDLVKNFVGERAIGKVDALQSPQSWQDTQKRKIAEFCTVGEIKRA